MTKTRTTPVVLLSGLIALFAIIGFAIFPALQRTIELRNEIDFQRGSLKSVTEKQRDIESVSRDFTAISEQNNALEKLVLTEPRTIAFYDAVDSALAEAKVSGGNVRLEFPAGAANNPQLIGLRIQFTSTFSQAQTVFHALNRIETLIATTQLSAIRSPQRDGTIDVVLSAQVAWEATP